MENFDFNFSELNWLTSKSTHLKKSKYVVFLILNKGQLSLKNLKNCYIIQTQITKKLQLDHEKQSMDGLQKDEIESYPWKKIHEKSWSKDF